MIGAKTLFRSCEMPPARVPMLSSRWFCSTWDSSSLRSVMSLMKPSSVGAGPSGPGTERPRSQTHFRPPSRVRMR